MHTPKEPVTFFVVRRDRFHNVDDQLILHQESSPTRALIVARDEALGNILRPPCTLLLRFKAEELDRGDLSNAYRLIRTADYGGAIVYSHLRVSQKPDLRSERFYGGFERSAGCRFLGRRLPLPSPGKFLVVARKNDRAYFYHQVDDESDSQSQALQIRDVALRHGLVVSIYDCSGQEIAIRDPVLV